MSTDPPRDTLELTRRGDETWLDAALRYAHPYKLETEVREAYERYLAAGDDESVAAWSACYDWDVLPR